MNRIIFFLFTLLSCSYLFSQKHILVINGKAIDNQYLAYRYKNSGDLYLNKDIKTFIRKFALEQAIIDEGGKHTANKSDEHLKIVEQIVNIEREKHFFNYIIKSINPLLQKAVLSDKRRYIIHQILIRLGSRSTYAEQNNATERLKNIRLLAIGKDSLTFAKLIDEYSDDKNISVVDETNGLPEILSALQDISVSEVSDIIETAEGLHLVRLIGYKTDLVNDFRNVISAIDTEKLFNTLIANYTYSENKVNTTELQNNNSLQLDYIQIGNERYTSTDYELFKKNRTEKENVLWNEFKLKSLLSYIYDQTSSVFNKYYEKQVSDSILYSTYNNTHEISSDIYDEKELSRFFLKNKKKYKWEKEKKYTALYCANDKKTLKKIKKQVKADLKTGNNFFIGKVYHNYQDNYATIYSLHEKNVDFEEREYETILSLKERYKYQSFISKQSKYPLSYTEVRNKVSKDYKTTVVKDEEATLLKKYKVEIDYDLLKTLNN